MTIVMFCHSVPGTPFDPDPAITARRGVRLVGSPRPGYGSTPALDGVPTLLAGAEVLADHLATEAVDHVDHIVGWSGGGHWALALAATRPDLVGSVTLVGTPAPDEAVPWIPDELRPGLELMRETPSEAVGMLLGALDGTPVGPELVCAGDRDEALLADRPDLSVALSGMLDRAVEQGMLGMAQDLVAQHVSPWSFDPSDIRCPVSLIHGSDDPLVGVEHGHHWAELLGVELTIVDDAGHLVVAEAWEAILDTRVPSG